MVRHYRVSTILAGVLGFSTLCLFYTGANALDLSDFTGADRKVITEEAPKAGGVILVKEDVVQQPSQVKVLTAQPASPPPMRNRGPYLTSPSVAAARTDASIAETGSTFNEVRTRMTTPGVASAPVDGKPLTTTTLASGDRVEDLNAIAPAAGSSSVYVSREQSVSAMTGNDAGRNKPRSFNN
jgi:hypothetical protein